MRFFVAAPGIPVPIHTSHLLSHISVKTFWCWIKVQHFALNLNNVFSFASLSGRHQSTHEFPMFLFSVHYRRSIMHVLFSVPGCLICVYLLTFSSSTRYVSCIGENTLAAIFAHFSVHWTICSCHSCLSSLFTQCCLTDRPACLLCWHLRLASGCAALFS